jgi:hypothetical protein
MIQLASFTLEIDNKKWKVYGQRTCDGNISDEILGQGELKNHSPTLFIDKLYVKLKFASANKVGCNSFYVRRL